jgi:emfourin
VQVDVVRRGGIAGVALRGDVDTTALPAATRSAVEQELARLPFGQAPPPSHPDAFQYEIVVVGDGGTSGRRAVLDERAVPDVLRPVIKEALARGHLA